MPIDTLFLNGEHLEVLGKCPDNWRSEIPIEVFDPWTSRWFTVVSVVLVQQSFMFILNKFGCLRTRDLKRLTVRIKL